jgi:hypothetical protein
MDLPDDNDQKWKRVVGGYNVTNPFHPIYFQDPDYRQRRTAHIKNELMVDENKMLLIQQQQKDQYQYRQQQQTAPGIIDKLNCKTNR